ncbi:MAG TPA: SRPBCC family protein [Puia sp.]
MSNYSIRAIASPVRHLLVTILFLVTVQFMISAQASAQSNRADSIAGITIHQEADFAVSPQKIYDLLLSSEQFSACTKKSFDMFTLSSAKIDPHEGGAFSLFDGHIIGRIIELVPGARIVEAWRVVDWPSGVYSIAKFELTPQGSGTKLVFEQVGFPEGLKQHLSVGWKQHYWDAFIKYFQ